MDRFEERLLNAIPGGCHTYSRGRDQFPSNAPSILSKGKGPYVWDTGNHRYIDYGMGLRAVTLGYANERVNRAAIEQIEKGNGLTRASEIELLAAEKLIDIIPCADMVKFAKNGSNVTTAACKLARAYTGKKYILIPEEQPFFSFDDWFIGSTEIKKGIPKEHSVNTLKFKYGDIESVKKVFESKSGEIAGIMLEPATGILPCPLKCVESQKHKGKNECLTCEDRDKNFLVQLRNLCSKENCILIFDEMITGFRWDLKGAQNYFGVEPDLATFGKAMANGFSLAALTGRRDIMELGNIVKIGEERTFLLSSTHGAEMCSLGAFLETVKIYEEEAVTSELWENGRVFKERFEEIISKYNLKDYIQLTGANISLNYLTRDGSGKVSTKFRTLFAQCMVENGILMPWIGICRQHKGQIIDRTMDAIENTIATYQKALTTDINQYLKGSSIKPVFRKYN